MFSTLNYSHSTLLISIYGDIMNVQNTFIFLSLFVGCGGADKDTGTEEAFSPTAGNWSFGDTEYSTDECNLANNAATSPAIIDALIFTLTNVSETELTLTNASGIEYTCTLDGMTMTCETSSEAEIETYNDLEGNVVTDEDGNPVDPDATRVISLQAIGTFTDANTSTYTTTVTGDCTGEDCALLASDWGITEMPCTSTYSGTFTLQD